MSKKTPSKKEQFKKTEKSKLPIILGVIGATALTIGLIVTLGFRGQGQKQKEYFGDAVVASRSYIGEFISMTTVDPVIEDGQVKISLDKVNESNIVYFEVENDINQLVPLMAYITPTGRLFAGSSLCEPCRGKTFSLAGESLVCDTCRTTYNIETHKFISGSSVCGKYPPVNMNPIIEDDMIKIDLKEILSWRSRV